MACIRIKARVGELHAQRLLKPDFQMLMLEELRATSNKSIKTKYITFIRLNYYINEEME